MVSGAPGEIMETATANKTEEAAKGLKEVVQMITARVENVLTPIKAVKE